MICNLNCSIGKYSFSCDFNNESKDSTRKALEEYYKFYRLYRESHLISSRTWKFPILYIDDRPFAKITPNGSLDLIDKENQK